MDVVEVVVEVISSEKNVDVVNNAVFVLVVDGVVEVEGDVEGRLVVVVVEESTEGVLVVVSNVVEGALLVVLSEAIGLVVSGAVEDELVDGVVVTSVVTVVFVP